MPELPEVQTTVAGLSKVLPKLQIIDVWTDLAVEKPSRPDYYHTIKSSDFFAKFKKEVIGAKVVSVTRRAKNILINLSNGNTILIHMKMTGHLLFGEYAKKQINNEQLSIKNGGNKITWEPVKNGPLRDPYNRFIHVVFSFSNGKHLAFCDSRKFGKVTLVTTKDSEQTIHLKNLGPEPLDKKFTEKIFYERLMKRQNWQIKTALMAQDLIAGIGNIYSDELLWLAGVNPESIVSKIPRKEYKKMFSATQKVLLKGIDFGGDSMSDYRRIDGTPGAFHHTHNAYRKTDMLCGKKNCRGTIKRKVIGGRSAHFCPIHQKLYD